VTWQKPLILLIDFNIEVAVLWACESNINWFKSYLANRKHSIHLNVRNNQNYYSSWEIVKWGVPQSSILGLLLIVIYINGLPTSFNHFSNVVLFVMTLVF
jgi:hypothetical protein